MCTVFFLATSQQQNLLPFDLDMTWPDQRICTPEANGFGLAAHGLPTSPSSPSYDERSAASSPSPPTGLPARSIAIMGVVPILVRSCMREPCCCKLRLHPARALRHRPPHAPLRKNAHLPRPGVVLPCSADYVCQRSMDLIPGTLPLAPLLFATLPLLSISFYVLPPAKYSASSIPSVRLLAAGVHECTLGPRRRTTLLPTMRVRSDRLLRVGGDSRAERRSSTMI